MNSLLTVFIGFCIFVLVSICGMVVYGAIFGVDDLWQGFTVYYGLLVWLTCVYFVENTDKDGE